MTQHLRLANLVTSVSLTAGFLALLVAGGHPALATGLVLVAAVLDGVDGALARRAGGDHTFGAQLDSLADFLCFCVVPAYTLFRTVHGASVAPAAVACGLVLAGAWRLARFPLVQQQGHFVGLPTPAAGGLVMLLALWAPMPLALLAAALLSALMVSTVRFPTVLAGAANVRQGRRTEPGGRRRGRRGVLVRTGRPGRLRPRRGGRQRLEQRGGRVFGALRRGRVRP